MIEFVAGVGSYFLGLYFSLVSPIHTPATECGKSQKVSYCYFAGAPGSKRIVYFLHGFGNDHNAWSWNPVTKRIEDEWKQKRLERPHVVVLSFGKMWWFNQPRGESLSQFVNHFEETKKITGSSRILYGDSMGGHNSVRWAASAPELFNKLALICPAMPLSFVGSPDKGTEGVWPFNRLADSLIVGNYAELQAPYNNVLLNPNYWQRLKAIPKIHVIVSTIDHFGFYTGGKRLQETFRKNGAEVSFEEQKVFHCNAEAGQLAPFLAL